MKKRRTYQKTCIISLVLFLFVFIVSCSNEVPETTTDNNKQIQQSVSVKPITKSNAEDRTSDPPVDSSETDKNVTTEIPDPVVGAQQLKVHFIDVGQGDATFIDYGDYDILIDGGNNGDGSLVANYLKSLGTDDIEILIATHNDADHIGGLDTVLQEFKVESIIDSGKSHTTKTYADYYNAAKTEPNSEFIEDSDMSFTLGEGVLFRVIEAGDGYSDQNENSVVSKLDYGDVEFLFTGDLESSVEYRILHEGIDADVLKVGHHGSKSSTSNSFLQAVRPQTAIISAGLNNSYGHPSGETLNRIKNYTTDIYGTYLSGTIVITTDGYTYRVNTDKKLTSPQQGSTKTTTNSSTRPKSSTQKDVIPNVKFVGSVNSDKYHFTDCVSATRIKESNEIWFNSSADAINKGYVPCKVCNPPQ